MKAIGSEEEYISNILGVMAIFWRSKEQLYNFTATTLRIFCIFFIYSQLIIVERTQIKDPQDEGAAHHLNLDYTPRDGDDVTKTNCFFLVPDLLQRKSSLKFIFTFKTIWPTILKILKRKIYFSKCYFPF